MNKSNTKISKCLFAFLFFITGCVSINLQQETARAINQIGQTIFLMDTNKNVYIKNAAENYGYGPEGKKFTILSKGDNYQLVDGSELELLSTKYLLNNISFDSFASALVTLNIQADSFFDDSKTERPEYKIYTLKYTGKSLKEEDSINSINATISEIQNQIIDKIIQSPHNDRDIIQLQIFTKLAELESFLIDRYYEEPSNIFNVFVVLKLYFNIKNQVDISGIMKKVT